MSRTETLEKLLPKLLESMGVRAVHRDGRAIRLEINVDEFYVLLAMGPPAAASYSEESFAAAVEQRARQKTEATDRMYKVICESLGNRERQIADLQREQRALIKALADKEPA